MLPICCRDRVTVLICMRRRDGSFRDTLNCLFGTTFFWFSLLLLIDNIRRTEENISCSSHIRGNLIYFSNRKVLIMQFAVKWQYIVLLTNNIHPHKLRYLFYVLKIDYRNQMQNSSIDCGEFVFLIVGGALPNIFC